MLDPNVGTVFIVIGCLALVVGVVYGLGPLVLHSRAASDGGSIRIRESDFFPGLTPTERFNTPTVHAASAASATAPDGGASAQQEPPQSAYDEGMVDELFSELFAVRTSIAELSSDLRALRSAWEQQSGLSPALSHPADAPAAPFETAAPSYDEHEAHRWAA